MKQLAEQLLELIVNNWFNYFQLLYHCSYSMFLAHCIISIEPWHEIHMQTRAVLAPAMSHGSIARSFKPLLIYYVHPSDGPSWVTVSPSHCIVADGSVEVPEFLMTHLHLYYMIRWSRNCILQKLGLKRLIGGRVKKRSRELITEMKIYAETKRSKTQSKDIELNVLQSLE